MKFEFEDLTPNVPVIHKAGNNFYEDIAMPTLNPRQRLRLGQGPIVPLEYAGQWVAWTKDLKRIIAHGATLDEVAQVAQQAGEDEIVFEKVPRPNSFVGSVRCR